MSKLAKALTAAAGNAAGESLYVEDVFSTYLYTGNSSTQTITNGIDLAGEGGLVWRQGRSAATGGQLIDTARGIGSYLISYSTDAAQTGSNWIDSFNSNGFTMNINSFNGGATYASWTFRKAEKFFDVLTYTGNGVAGRTVAHNLGSTPAVMIIKRTSTSGSNWRVYHTSLGNGQALSLNTTDAAGATTSLWNSTTPTDSVFTLGDNGNVNQSGESFVAYLFASDAGGFGDDGTENIISCGSFTTDGSGSATVSLGYEPQWVMIKRSDAADDWIMLDAMRGMSYSNCLKLAANASSAEYNFGANQTYPTATGFSINGTLSASGTYIYIAIRRGPMKVPTAGTEVFSPVSRAGTSAVASVTTPNFPPDLVIIKNQTAGIAGRVRTKLTGPNVRLVTSSTDVEVPDSDEFRSFDQLGYTFGANSASDFGTQNYSGYTYINWAFKRATGFFDAVAYTGTGSNTSINHNLGVAPELMIVKRRNSSRVWAVWASGIDIDDYLTLNGSAGVATFSLWQSTLPTATQITLGTDASVNGSGDTYIGYLFATCPGVSKVGSYTGNGTSQTIDCGFSGGARFILIKSTSTTGSWWVYDSARGIVAGNDPALQLNSTAAEITSADAIDPDSSGFIVNQEATCSINASGVSYIFMSIA